MKERLTFQWVNDPACLDTLVNIFLEDADPRYISHGEIQDGRAINPDQWSPDLSSKIKEDLMKAVTNWNFNRSQGVAIVCFEGVPIGFILIEFEGTRHVIIQDMVLRPSKRSLGYGTAFAGWLKTELHNMGIHRAFFESGIKNHDAHKLFESFGFKIISVVMMLDDLDSVLTE